MLCFVDISNIVIFIRQGSNICVYINIVIVYFWNVRRILKQVFIYWIYIKVKVNNRFWLNIEVELNFIFNKYQDFINKLMQIKVVGK